MKVGILPLEEPGIYRSLLLPEVADALADQEPLTALVVTLDETAFGAVAGYIEGNRFKILSLYIVPEYRRKGGGRLLIETLMSQAKDTVMGIEINFTTTEEEHETLHPFLETLGFVQENNRGLATYLTTVGALADSKFFKNCKAKVGIPFSELDKYILTSESKRAAISFDELPKGGLQSERVDRDISVATIHNQKITSYITIDCISPDLLLLSALRMDKSNPKEFFELMRSFVARTRDKYSPDTKYVVQIVREEGLAIKEKLLPTEMKQISFSYYRSLME